MKSGLFVRISAGGAAGSTPRVGSLRNVSEGAGDAVRGEVPPALAAADSPRVSKPGRPVVVLHAPLVATDKRTTARFGDGPEGRGSGNLARLLEHAVVMAA